MGHAIYTVEKKWETCANGYGAAYIWHIFRNGEEFETTMHVGSVEIIIEADKDNQQYRRKEV